MQTFTTLNGRRVLRRMVWAAAAAAALSASTAQAAVCARSYSLDIARNDYTNSGPILQLSGSICTDGTLGTLGADNITAWNLTVQNLSFGTSFTLDSTASGAQVQLTQLASPGALSASATSLSWDVTTPTYPDYDYLEFTDASGNFLEWLNYPFSTPYSGIVFGNTALSATYTAALPSGPQIIGSGGPPALPEPSSLALAGLALAALALRRQPLRKR